MNRRTASGRTRASRADGPDGSRRLDPAATRPDGPTPGSSADEATEPDPESVARTIVLRRLTAAPRTRAQLAEDLRRRDVPDEVAERVLDRFGEVGLVDDEAFADAWVRSRHTGRGLARRALAHELRQRGVDDATVQAAVDAVDVDSETAAAAALVARRLPATRGLPHQTRVRRLAGLLARKGYSSGLAMTVVRAALEAESQSSDDGRAGGDISGGHVPEGG